MAARFAYTISRGWIERVMLMPWRRLWFVIFGALLVSLLFITPASSAGILDKAGESIANFLAGFILQIASLFVGIMAFFVSLLINVASYNDFINMPGVKVGWALVRDIANMFFVVILLVIAFGTIIGHEQYHYKKLLPRFVGAAILINFSRLLVGIIIDASQVIMMTFVNAISQVGGGNFIQAFQINDAWRVADNPSSGGLEQVITAIFVMVLMFIAAVLIGMFALLLVLRVVTLWVLIVLSPLAALLYVLPFGDFQKYYNEWWTKFKGNVYLGPIVAFFLWLALTMSGNGTGLYAEIKNKGGGKADFSEAQTVVKKGITGSAISSIENLSSFIIAAAIFFIALDMAQRLASEAGLPGGSAITKAAGGLIKGGIGEMTGYSAAGRALAPAWKQVKEISAKTAPGTGLGKQLERGVLAAGAMAPGAAGKEANERLTAARWDDTQKAQQKLKRQTNEELEAKLKSSMLPGGAVPAESRAAALELVGRGHRLTPEQMKFVGREMEKDPKAFDQLKQSMKRSMPELAYDLSDATQRKAMLKDPDAKHENLGVRAFTDATGLVTDDGSALIGELLLEKGAKGFTKLVEDMKDPKAKEAVLKVMREELIPQRVAATAASKARLEGPAGVKARLASQQVALKTLQDSGDQSRPAQQQRLVLVTDIKNLMKEKDTLESEVKAGGAMVETYAKETGRPDEAVQRIADPALRQKEMAVVIKKVKPDDLKEDALKDVNVLEGMRVAFGGQVGEFVGKLKIEQQNAVREGVQRIDVSVASREAVEAKLVLGGDFSGIEARPDGTAITETVARTVRADDLARVQTATIADMDAFMNGLRQNLGAVKALPGAKGVNEEILGYYEREAAALPAGDLLRNEIEGWQISGRRRRRGPAGGPTAGGGPGGGPAAGGGAAGGGGGGAREIDLGEGGGPPLELDDWRNRGPA